MKNAWYCMFMSACEPTCVYEPPWCAFAELFRLVRQSDLYNPGDVSGRRLHPDGMWCNQLEEEGTERQESNLHKY